MLPLIPTTSNFPSGKPIAAGMLAAVLLLAVGCATGGAPASTSPSVAKNSAPSAVDPSGLEAAMKAGTIALFDVRTPGEYAEGHVPGAINIPLDQLSVRMSELEPHKDAPVYLICASGGRSGRAQTQLASAGFAQPINVTGGTREWQALGKPLE